MLLAKRKLRIETERMTLRPPIHSDFRAWTALRAQSMEYLTPWEPSWAEDHLSRKAFTNRVYWAQRSVSGGTALPLFLIRRQDDILLGAITLDNIRRGPAQAGTVGYWIGEQFARNGFMSEALGAVVHHAFSRLDHAAHLVVVERDRVLFESYHPQQHRGEKDDREGNHLGSSPGRLSGLRPAEGAPAP